MWGAISELALQSLPLEVRNASLAGVNLLRAFLAEDAYCWIYAPGDEVEGVVITTFQYDVVVGQRYLYIYSFAVKQNTLKEEIWTRAIEEFRFFARESNCQGMLALSAVPISKRIADGTGGVSGHLLYWVI